jgi:hypothetical protein
VNKKDKLQVWFVIKQNKQKGIDSDETNIKNALENVRDDKKIQRTV